MAPSIAQDAIGAGSIVSPRLDSFHQLVADLSKILGPSGLNSSDIEVRELQTLMESYISSESEWITYAFQDLSRGYTRNLVDEGNGKCNLVYVSLPLFQHGVTNGNGSWYLYGHQEKAAQSMIMRMLIAL